MSNLDDKMKVDLMKTMNQDFKNQFSEAFKKNVLMLEQSIKENTLSD